MAVGVGGHGEPPGHDVIFSVTDHGHGASPRGEHRDERIIAYACGLCIPAGLPLSSLARRALPCGPRTVSKVVSCESCGDGPNPARRASTLPDRASTI
jgi:hypothetical protein